MHARTNLVVMLASITLLGIMTTSEAKSQEFEFDFRFEDFFGIFDNLLPPVPLETRCSSLPGAIEMIEQSGGIPIPSDVASYAMALFNANSTHHCKTIPLNEEPKLHFETSYKDRRGVVWHLFSTTTFGEISYVWRRADIPYA